MSGRGIGNHSEAVGRRLAGLGEGLHLGIRGRGRIAMTAWLREVYAAFDKKGGLSAVRTFDAPRAPIILEACSQCRDVRGRNKVAGDACVSAPINKYIAEENNLERQRTCFLFFCICLCTRTGNLPLLPPILCVMPTLPIRPLVQIAVCAHRPLFLFHGS
jgi:hypothetical protein